MSLGKDIIYKFINYEKHNLKPEFLSNKLYLNFQATVATRDRYQYITNRITNRIGTKTK